MGLRVEGGEGGAVTSSQRNDGDRVISSLQDIYF